MQAKYDGEIDLDVLLCRLLQKELVFSAIEKDDLPALTQRRRDEGKIYVLGDSNFLAPADAVVVSTVTPKALGLVGDEQLSVVAREALPANAKVNKKAVELMGSTKVVTEKKALKVGMHACGWGKAWASGRMGRTRFPRIRCLVGTLHAVLGAPYPGDITCSCDKGCCGWKLLSCCVQKLDTSVAAWFYFMPSLEQIYKHLFSLSARRVLLLPHPVVHY